MDLPAAQASEAGFAAYLAKLARVMGDKDGEEP
jgi:hypothetical protein